MVDLRYREDPIEEVICKFRFSKDPDMEFTSYQKFEYEMGNDPMQNLEKSEIEDLLKLPSKIRKENKTKFDILKNAKFTENSASLQLDVKFKKN